jgi:hypothetical protein
MRPQMFVLAGIAAAAVAMAACGGGGDGSAKKKPESLRDIFAGQVNADTITKQQEAVRDCMVEQGFEYTPADNRAEFNTVEFDPDDEEWVKEHGFGISTGFGPGGGGFSVGAEVTRDEGDDPNAAYRASLSPDQQAAYDKALYGRAQDIPSESGGDSAQPGVIIGSSGPGDEPQGCFGKAFAQEGGPFQNRELGDAIQDLDQRIKGDERIVDANRDWAACMSEQGYTYASRDDAIEDIASRFRAIIGVEEPSGDGNAVIVIRPGDDPSANYDQAALADLRAEELRTATASVTCGKDTIGKVEPKVRAEYEKQFIEDHPELVADADAGD